jgi:hypothetical protein
VSPGWVVVFRSQCDLEPLAEEFDFLVELADLLLAVGAVGPQALLGDQGPSREPPGSFGAGLALAVPGLRTAAVVLVRSTSALVAPDCMVNSLEGEAGYGCLQLLVGGEHFSVGDRGGHGRLADGLGHEPADHAIGLDVVKRPQASYDTRVNHHQIEIRSRQ